MMRSLGADLTRAPTRGILRGIWRGRMFDPASLFASGERGVLYDDDITAAALYQFLAPGSPGSEPVTGADQPVGVRLDSSRGIAPGPELFSDASVAFIGTVGHQERTAPGHYCIARTSSGLGRIRLATGLTVGDTYEIRFTVNLYTGANTGAERALCRVGLQWGTGEFVTDTGQMPHEWQMRVIAVAAGPEITAYNPSAACDLYGISIRRIAGASAKQGTSAARPFTRRVPILGSDLWSMGAVTLGAGVETGLSTSTGLTYRISLPAGVAYNFGPGWVYANADPLVLATSQNLRFRNMTAAPITLTPSVREVTGYSDQLYIDFDSADDSLVTTFPTALGGACTIVRAVPHLGAVILEGQNIGTTFTDTSDNAGLIILNRALTAAERAGVTHWANQKVGL